MPKNTKVWASDSIWCFTHNHWVLPNPGWMLPSQRDDGLETIMWLNHGHLVQSIDLSFDDPDGERARARREITEVLGHDPDALKAELEDLGL